MNLTVQEINSKIYEVRGLKVMLDSDLAKLYQVETKVLNQAVKRNIERFPEDFMLLLTDGEEKSLRSQFVTLEIGEEKSMRGKHRKYNSFVFTEHGIAMLSSVLRSDIAIEVNIQIMRTFTAIRKYALTHDELAKRLEELEAKVEKGEQVDRQILDVLTQLISEEKTNKATKKIGFV
jgi:hypothetical protein